MTYLLHHLVSESAATHPDREALRCRGRSMTYQELEAASNGIARALIDAGVERGDRVGIYVPKDLEMMPAVNGAMKAGASFVPLDPGAPAPRVALMMEDCSPIALVATPGRAAEALQATEYRPKLVLLVDDGSGPVELPCPTLSYADLTADPAATDPGVPSIEMDLSCIAYTSGSTGVPKGVMHTHRALLNAAEWFVERLSITAEDRLAVHSPLHFLMSGYSLWAAARTGASAVLITEDEAGWGSELARIIRDDGVTIWFSVNQALMLILQTDPGPASFPSVRSVAFGGAALTKDDMRQLKEVFPAVEFVYFLGSTEAWGTCSYHFTDPPYDEWPLPVGRPLSNVDVISLKEDGTVAGPGEEGELYVRTPSVMRGYWGMPDLTERALVPNPLDPHLRDLVYRSGDLLRLRPDGNYEFVGRRDLQAKIRGYRVEPEEVERVILSHASIREAAVVPVPHPEWGKTLVARVVPRGENSLTTADLKGYLADRLPLYMVPERVEFVEDLPRTSSGKLDRARVLAEVSPDAPPATSARREEAPEAGTSARQAPTA
jgi:amino acid adenylation domain-containing protein